MIDSYQSLSLKAAQAIADLLKAEPAICLGLPTGRTPIAMYEILAEWSRQKLLDWSKARCFALDDYLDALEKHSFAYYLEHHLYQYTNLPDRQKFNPCTVDNYDQLITSSGGLDLTVVGIGSNGHVAFNEPGTPPGSWTHSIWLTESTRKANASFFGSFDLVPRKAVTMGIKTILFSRRLILIANGEQKRDILSRALHGPVGSQVPASFLQQHGHLTVLADFDFEDSRA